MANWRLSLRRNLTFYWMKNDGYRVKKLPQHKIIDRPCLSEHHCHRKQDFSFYHIQLFERVIICTINIFNYRARRWRDPRPANPSTGIAGYPFVCTIGRFWSAGIDQVAIIRTEGKYGIFSLA